MDEKHKKLLVDNTRYLVESLDFKSTILADNLVQNKVLTRDGKEQLESLTSKNKIASEFVNHVLPRRGPKAFEMFIKSLMETEGQDFIAEKLCPELAQKYGSCEGPVGDGGHPLPTPVQQEQSDEEIVAQLVNPGSALEALQTVSRQTAEDAIRRNTAYKLIHNKRGRAVIINNEFFDDDELIRQGAQRDLQDLKTLFQRLMFDVQVHENKTGKEMEDIVRNESELDHSNYDAFVLFVLSHGSNGHVVGADHIIGTDIGRVKVDELVTIIGGCHTLAHKPKILLFQCCRGAPAGIFSRTRPDAAGSTTEDDGMRLLKQSARVGRNWTDAELSSSADPGVDDDDGGDVSNCKDVFVAYSTLSGCASFRNTVTGSWFVRFFVYVCCTQGHREDLESMTKVVNRLLTIKLKKEGQVCETLAKGLRYKIFFFPGYAQSS